MQKNFSRAVMALLILSPSAIQAAEDSLDERLEKLWPRAAGVALVEVVRTKVVDTRDGDGPLFLEVRLKILRGTGSTPNTIRIVTAYPEGEGYPPARHVRPDEFRKGDRHWIVFRSQYDFGRNPRGVFRIFPEIGFPEILEDAVRNDKYAHHPQHHYPTKLTHSHQIDEDRKSCRISMERGKKILWEKELPGEERQGESLEGEWRLFLADYWPSGLKHVPESRSGWTLFAESIVRLDATNDYGVDAGEHRITYVLDAERGHTIAIWISRRDDSPYVAPPVIRFFDHATDKLKREERYEVLEQGGLAAGAKQERWLRRTVRTFDLDTGKQISEEVVLPGSQLRAK